MNLNKALDKAYESKSLTQILDSPVDALSGVSAADAVKLKDAFGIVTVRDLANNKYFRRAQAIAALENSEETASAQAG